MSVRAVADGDRAWIRELAVQRWGLPVVSTSGTHDPSVLPGFIAEAHGKPIGAITYRVVRDECEVVTIETLVPGQGLGRALLDAVRRAAEQRRCRRLWLITTNENLDALRFYQRYGMDLVALHRDFVDVVRRAKPELSLRPVDGIPFRHALELELRLD